MTVPDLLLSLRRETETRSYISRLEMLDQSASLLKARLYIASDLFVQVYRNDRFDTTNLALLHNGQCIYARDQLGGVWHRHTASNPHQHDKSEDGRRPVTLSEFLDEVESVLAALNLP